MPRLGLMLSSRVQSSAFLASSSTSEKTLETPSFLSSISLSLNSSSDLTFSNSSLIISSILKSSLHI